MLVALAVGLRPCAPHFQSILRTLGCSFVGGNQLRLESTGAASATVSRGILAEEATIVELQLIVGDSRCGIRVYQD